MDGGSMKIAMTMAESMNHPEKKSRGHYWG
jgi:hypothetical protein